VADVPTIRVDPIHAAKAGTPAEVWTGRSLIACQGCALTVLALVVALGFTTLAFIGNADANNSDAFYSVTRVSIVGVALVGGVSALCLAISFVRYWLIPVVLSAAEVSFAGWVVYAGFFSSSATLRSEITGSALLLLLIWIPGAFGLIAAALFVASRAGRRYFRFGGKPRL
jgi:hypothetical protein